MKLMYMKARSNPESSRSINLRLLQDEFKEEFLKMNWIGRHLFNKY